MKSGGLLFDIPRTATPEEIEDKYHYYAKKYHPDRARSPDAHEKFIKIKEAYEILKDPQKRKAYDISLPPEEKVMEISASSDNSSSQEPAQEPQVPDAPEPSGSKSPFRTTTISYVSFKSGNDPLSAGQSTLQSSESQAIDWSRYVSSGKSQDSEDNVSSGESGKNADWSSVKVRYEGLVEEVDDSKHKKHSSMSSFLLKTFVFALVLVCLLATVAVVSPGQLEAIGLESVVNFFDKLV